MQKDMFYVFVEGGRMPEIDHVSFSSATAEAIRLAEKMKKPMHVVQCLDTFLPTVKKIEQVPLPCKICGLIPNTHFSCSYNRASCGCGVVVSAFEKHDVIKKWNKLMSVEK
jgi:hypothetical protein